MKFRTLKKWDDPSECSQLVYLAQLLEELLFDYSLDTYKPSAMNTSMLCFEALTVIKDIENGVIKEANLPHIIDELSLNMSKDPVSKKLISIDYPKAITTISTKETRLSEKKIILELIWSEIELKKYKIKNEQLLINAIENDQEKSTIRTLARSYITTLINLGYRPNHLYQTTIDFFHYSKNRIGSNEAIKDYVSKFDGKRSQYTVIYRASEIFNTLIEACAGFNVEVTNDAKEYTAALEERGYRLRNKNELFVIIKEIKCLDHYSARELAVKKIETIATLLTLYHHKEHPSWNKECVVIEVGSKKSRKIGKPLNPMHKCFDLVPDKASKKLNTLLSNFSLTPPSFNRFSRSAELHSLALNSDSQENQMINLWISLESLVPSSTKDSKIINILDSVMPFLNLNYVNRLLERLFSDLIVWNRGVLFHKLKGIEGSKTTVRLAKLLSLNSHEDAKKSLFADLGDFHLLRNRVFHIAEILDSGKKIGNLLKNHDKRVRWQLRRIYRTRNIIVHTGRTPSYTGILIENIHDYLDIILSTLVNIASGGINIDSIEQGFKYIELTYDSYFSTLNLTDKFDEANIEEVLFRHAI